MSQNQLRLKSLLFLLGRYLILKILGKNPKKLPKMQPSEMKGGKFFSQIYGDRRLKTHLYDLYWKQILENAFFHLSKPPEKVPRG